MNCQKFLSLYLLVALMGCNKSTNSIALEGLWKLDVLEVDGVEENHPPYFLQMNNDGSFAVAKRSGDLPGFFEVNGSQILFTSSDRKWFNVKWKLEILGDKIRLTGKGDYGGKPHFQGGPRGILNTRLTFEPVASIPDFQAFEDAMTGNWELYKIRRNGNSVKLENTRMLIEGGRYAIEGPDQSESGIATINTRYRKVFFEGQDTAWDAWFFGMELRLSNDQMGLVYSLKR